MAYVRFFTTENEARDRCSLKNRACKRAGNYKDIFCLVEGPDSDFSVVDLSTAIDLGQGYEIVD
jgi:hypothetical protein